MRVWRRLRNCCLCRDSNWVRVEDDQGRGVYSLEEERNNEVSNLSCCPTLDVFAFACQMYWFCYMPLIIRMEAALQEADSICWNYVYFRSSRERRHGMTMPHYPFL
jgi:hypothetical protein